MEIRPSGVCKSCMEGDTWGSSLCWFVADVEIEGSQPPSLIPGFLSPSSKKGNNCPWNREATDGLEGSPQRVDLRHVSLLSLQSPRLMLPRRMGTEDLMQDGNRR